MMPPPIPAAIATATTPEMAIPDRTPRNAPATAPAAMAIASTQRGSAVVRSAAASTGAGTYTTTVRSVPVWLPFRR